MRKVFYLAKQYFYLLAVLFTLFSWTLSFYHRELDIISGITWSLIFVPTLFFAKDKSKALFLILLVPFKYGYRYNVAHLPLDLIIICASGVISIVTYAVIKKVRLDKGHYFYGLAALLVAATFGGVFSKYFSWSNFFSIGAIMVVGLSLYVLMLSIVGEMKFESLVKMMSYLGIFIILNVSIYCFLVQPDITQKKIYLGWGVTNNIALMLLGIIPFTFYKVAKSNAKKLPFNYLILCAECIVLLFTFSRGSLIVFALVEVTILFSLFFVIKEIKLFTIINLITIFVIFIAAFTIYYVNPAFLTKAYNTLKSIDFTDLNGRRPLYNEAWSIFKQHPIAGLGLYGGFYWNDKATGYAWAHGTLFHTMITMGSIGVLALCYHMAEKYYFLLKKITYQKVIIFLAFFACDCYGFFDVSYYYPIYMVFLIVLLIGIEGAVKK